MSTSAAKKITVEDRIRLITGADDLEREMHEVGSVTDALGLIVRRHRAMLQKGREVVESVFWLGGAISRAHGMSEWGESFFPTLRANYGITEACARRALRLWDLFAGDIVRLHQWYSEYLQDYGRVLLGDVDRLIAANRDIIDARQYLRKVDGKLERQDIDEALVRRMGLRAAIDRKKTLTATAPIKRPAPPKEGIRTKFRKVRGLAEAKRKLVFDPDADIVIAEATLADEVTYELVVSMRAKTH